MEQRSVFYGPGLLIVLGGGAPLILWADDDTGDHWLDNVSHMKAKSLNDLQSSFCLVSVLPS